MIDATALPTIRNYADKVRLDLEAVDRELRRLKGALGSLEQTRKNLADYLDDLDKPLPPLFAFAEAQAKEEAREQAPEPSPEVEEPAQIAEDITALPPWWGKGKDETAVIEKGLAHAWNPGPPSESVLRELEAIIDWRDRQAKGDLEPHWMLWTEFQVTTSDGSPVTVISTGCDGHLLLSGPVCESGWRGHLKRPGLEPLPEEGVREYAQRVVDAYRRDYLRRLAGQEPVRPTNRKRHKRDEE